MSTPTPTAPTLYTVGELARRCGVSFAQIKYALDASGIQPACRAGIFRLFSEQQIPEVEKAVNRTARRPVAASA